jgi:hypothetical protein
VAILTLPGVRLLHEGQFEGRHVRLPVFLGRRPAEPDDADLAAVYTRLLEGTRDDVLRNGTWRLCDCGGWPDNQSCRQILSWCWAKGDQRVLVVVNYAATAAQGVVLVPWDDIRSREWCLTDVLTGRTYERNGTDMRDAGLYVDLGPWQSHVFRLHPS